MPRYVRTPLPYRRPPETAGAVGSAWPVAIVGAGPVGLSAAIDLALHGVRSVVLDDLDTVAAGSRAVGWAQRTLEIFARLGVAERMVEQGVGWQVSRVFHRERELYHDDLQPEPGHRWPPFVNLQQYHVERLLIDRCADFPDLIELRFRNRVVGLQAEAAGVTLQVETPDGPYLLEAAWVIAADGARSLLRRRLDLPFVGEAFEERFLVADVELRRALPAERRFWFEPPFERGQSALLHKQPDDLYRIEVQLAADTDPVAAKQPAAVARLVEAMTGAPPAGIDWVAVYGFQCRRLERFRHGRVIFAGDAAHVVPPFGARGGNAGIQDVDNLAWKLALVLQAEAPEALLDTYDEERSHAADLDLEHSARTTRFMTPAAGSERMWRDAVLDLAAVAPFARAMVDAGRLSTPCSLAGRSAITPAAGENGLEPGAPCPDAPVGQGDWLLDHLGGGFRLLRVGDGVAEAAPVTGPGEVVRLPDTQGLVAQRYGRGRIYLVRPDQHMAARFDDDDDAGLAAAHARALGLSPTA